jgi:hypothetical protein
LRWDNGSNGKEPAIDPKYSVTPEVAIRFLPEEQAAYHGKKITSAAIYPVTLGSDMYLNIRQDGKLIHTQPLNNLTPGKYNNIPLSAPVVIDSTKTLMAGYSYKQYNAVDKLTVFGADAATAVSGKNWYSYNSGYTFSEYKSGNWNIALYVNSYDVAFNVYRNGTKIASLAQGFSYEDANPPANTNVCYAVSAVFDNNPATETALSESKCVLSAGIQNPVAENMFDIYRQGNDVHVRNLSSENGDFYLYNISGQLICAVSAGAGKTVPLNASLHGIYLLKAVYPVSGISTRKIVL